MQSVNQEKKSSAFRKSQLKKLGLNLNNWNYVVALAGNPNTGKSTVFNNLTGLKQHTGNWPGKTVNRAEGGFEYEDTSYKLVDLPGTYSLLSTSDDEEIARNFLLFAQPDVTVIVVDATRLQRNLNLVLQILEITPQAVICLNLMDEADRKGIQVDDEALQEKLGVPVVPTVARQKDGQEALLKAIHKVATAEQTSQAAGTVARSESKEVETAIRELQDDLDQLYPELPNTRWLAFRLLDGDERIEKALVSGELQQLSNQYRQKPLDLEKELEEINKAV